MNEREFGTKLSISIGTAVPLEFLLENEQKGITHLYMNIRTLHRNYHGSYIDDNRPTDKKYIQAFIEELKIIKSIITETLTNVTPVFYYCSLKSMHSVFTRAKIKHPHTDLQKKYAELEDLSIQKILQDTQGIEIKIFDILIKGGNTSSLMMTHLPLDLLSLHEFKSNSLKLIESHTGGIKNKTEWITKLSKNPNYRNIPFNILSIQVIGDRSKQFEPMGNKFTKVLIEIAKSNKWSSMTTLEKVKFDIRKYFDKLSVEVLLRLSEVRLK